MESPSFRLQSGDSTGHRPSVSDQLAFQSLFFSEPPCLSGLLDPDCLKHWVSATIPYLSNRFSSRFPPEHNSCFCPPRLLLVSATFPLVLLPILRPRSFGSYCSRPLACPMPLVSAIALLVLSTVLPLPSLHCESSWLCFPMLYSCLIRLEWATNQTRSLLWGALTAQAGNINGNTSYPAASRSACTSWKTSPPDQLTRPRTFSPTTQFGRTSPMTLSISGQRWRSSSLPNRFPAAE